MAREREASFEEIRTAARLEFEGVEVKGMNLLEGIKLYAVTVLGVSTGTLIALYIRDLLGA